MSELLIPPAINVAVAEFNARTDGFSFHDLERRLSVAWQAAPKKTDEERLGAFADLLAFGLSAETGARPPLNTYFGPLMSYANSAGEDRFSPDPREVTGEVLDHWQARLDEVAHPLLRARYADLLWEFAKIAAGRRRDPAHARIASEAYISAVRENMVEHSYERSTYLRRALDLACFVRDDALRDAARVALIELFHQAIESGVGHWSDVYDRLIQRGNIGLTAEENDALLRRLEGNFTKFSDTSSSERFNPFELEDVSKKLLRHYARSRSHADFVRIHSVVGHAFEHLASLSSAMQAIGNLQSAENAFRQAGRDEDVVRVRLARADAVRRSRDEMTALEHTVTIKKEDLEKFSEQIVGGSLRRAFSQLAANFVPSANEIREGVQRQAEEHVLSSLIPMQILAEDRVVGTVGSVEGDLDGRMIQDTWRRAQFEGLWLNKTFEMMFEKHQVFAHDIAGWSAQSGAFDDISLIIEGVEAWIQRDWTKALFVLTPQIEVALRNIARGISEPVTKPHPTMKDREVARNLGDLLALQSMKAALGNDLHLFFRVLFSDPRALNLRNEVAHGLIAHDHIGERLCDLLVLTVIVLGVWPKLKEARENVEEARSR